MFRFRNLIIIPGLLGKFDTREDRNEKHEKKSIHLHLKNKDTEIGALSGLPRFVARPAGPASGRGIVLKIIVVLSLKIM